ncbi:MAG: sulfotransferase [Planctomycetota bacterium]
MKSVAVIGMHRSGTSVITSLVAGLGVHFGDQLLLPSWTNPFGYYEDHALMRLGDRVLTAAGGNWLVPPPREALAEAFAKYADDYRGVIDRLSQPGTDFGIKEPRFTLFFEHLVPLLPDAHLIFCRRDVDGVIRSLVNRGHDPAASRACADRYQADADRLADELAATYPTLVIEFKEMTSDPTGTVRDIARLIGVEATEAEYARVAKNVRTKKEIKQRAGVLWALEPGLKVTRWWMKRGFR